MIYGESRKTNLLLTKYGIKQHLLKFSEFKNHHKWVLTNALLIHNFAALNKIFHLLKINYMQTKTQKMLFIVMGALFLASCADDNAMLVSNEKVSSKVEEVSLLEFKDKDVLKNAIENAIPVTRSVSGNPNFISLMDVVREDDPLYIALSAEEQQEVKENSLSYYEVLEYENIIPNENFARLLNSKGEIQVKDSIYRITHFGTLCANVEHKEEIELAYIQLQKDTVDFSNESLSFVQVTPYVKLVNSYHRINFNEESAGSETANSSITRTATKDIPYGTFPHYSSNSHTFVGKIFGGIFGDRSVKHHNFMKGYRIKGSLYDYDYGPYAEVGTFVASRKKRGGFFRKLNGWKGVKAQELSITYKGIVLEMDLKIPTNMSMPKAPIIVGNHSSLEIKGAGKPIVCLDICGLEITDAQIGKIAKEGLPALKKIVGNNINSNTRAARILTPSKLYIVILDNQINEYNVEQVRKVFSSSVKFFISSSIISNPISVKAAADLFNGLRSLTVKRMKYGEVILAGKINNRWGGMVITKK